MASSDRSPARPNETSSAAVSANEGAVANHDLSPTGEISLHAIARRALKEELAVQSSDRVDLELLGFGLDLLNNQWAAFFRAVLEDLSEDELRFRWSRGIEDKWEHDEYAFVPEDPESALSFIHHTDAWTPCAPTLFYLALVRGAVRAREGTRPRACWSTRPSAPCCAKTGPR